MSSSDEQQEILRRLQALEEENARLRKAAESQTNKLTVVEGEYNGHPTLTFQGPFRHFTLGLKKLRVVKEAWKEVEAFLQRHAHHKSKSSNHDDDDKI